MMKMLSICSSSIITSMAARKCSAVAVASTSMGLWTEASGYSFSFKTSFALSERGGISRPALTSTSVAMTAGPPVLVIIPTRLPRGMGWVAKATAAWHNSPSSLKLSTPAFSKMRSVEISTRARPPV